MTTLASSPLLSDWLKAENQHGKFSGRDQAVVASGQGKLTTGTVMGKVTATGKWVVWNPGSSDGSQTEVGVLIGAAANEAMTLDATSADVSAVMMCRGATVSHAGLIWGPAANTAQNRALGVAALKAKNIIDRQSA